MSKLTRIMNQTTTPHSSPSLVADLRALGIRPGLTLIAHSSLSAMGYVIGDAPAVILALEEAVGETGTLAMPAHSANLSEPENWSDPAVPEAWHRQIRQHMPPFQPDLSPTWGLGTIPETFRKQAGTLRSNHPRVSWCARGPEAARITARHVLAMSQGETSPLARLYELSAQVLLLGVSFEVNTSFHLAEYRNKFAPRKSCTRQAPSGDGEWMTYDDIYWYDRDFLEIGTAYMASGGAIKRGKVGDADCLLFPQRDMVDFAVSWMNQHRNLG